MDVFKNTKISKKILIVLVILILFNFSYPKVVRAGDTLNWVLIGVESLFFGLFDGIQGIVDSLFLDDNHRNESVSTEAIVKGKFLLMSPNIFEDVSSNSSDFWDYDKVATGKSNLRDTVSAWYYALRNLAIVALLSILVYVAIRMILTSISQDKAKYKTMFKDWVVALCLLFLIHFIMVGILNMSSTITKAIGTSGQSYTTDLREKIDDAIDNATKETDDYSTDDDFVEETILDAMKNTVIYAAIVIMNIIFIVKYIIRAVTIIFLVLLAPITCITYPIDKISDGKAQAYDTWFKEFLYQVIIQPFHLLIYVVLIGSAAQLASDNLIYAMVCFGVMIPAEKFIKQMFGFKDKLGSPLGAFASGAVASQLMSSFKSAGKSSSGGGGKENDNGSNDDLPPRTKDMELPGTEGSDNNGNTPRTANDSTADNSLSTDEMGDSETTASSERDTAQTIPQAPEAVEDKTAIGEGENGQGAEQEGIGENGQGAEQEGIGENGQGAEQEGIGENGQEEKEKGLFGKAKELYGKGKDIVLGTKGGAAIASRHNSKLMRKYGTTDPRKLAARRAQRLGKKAYSATKNVGKRTIKGVAAAGGAIALGAFGAMFGKGREGMALGAALGNRVGNGVVNTAGKIAGKTKEYASDFYNAYGNHSDEKDKREFKENEGNIKLARLNYRDRTGKEADGKGLDQELENMYKLSSCGVNKDQYKSALNNFEEYKGELGEDNAWKTVVNQAKLAQAYSAKDFRDPKTMQQLSDNLREQYKALGKGEIAQENIDRLITGAAAMKGVKKVALPATNETIDVPIEQRLPEILGIDANSNDSNVMNTMSDLTVRLRSVGYSDDEIERLANMYRLNGGEGIGKFEETVNVAVEYMEDGNARHEAEKVARSLYGIANKEQVNQEMRERFVIKNTFNVTNENAVSAMRELELEKFDVKTEKTQIQAAREFAIQNREHIKGKNQGVIDEKIRLLTQELIKGGSSSDKAKKDAENIANLAGTYIE